MLCNECISSVIRESDFSQTTMSFTNFTSSVAGAAAAFAAFARESERSRFPIGSICEETRFIINEKSDERAVTFHLTTPLTQQHCMASEEDTITGRFNQDMTRISHRHVSYIDFV